MKKTVANNVHLTIFKLFLISSITLSITPKEADVIPSIVRNKLKSKLTHTYTPKEVDSLEEKKFIVASPTLKRVDIIDEKKDLTNEINQSNQKTENFADAPQIYSTIIKPKLTAIKRATYTKDGFKVEEKKPEEKIIEKTADSKKIESEKAKNISQAEKEDIILDKLEKAAVDSIDIVDKAIKKEKEKSERKKQLRRVKDKIQSYKSRFQLRKHKNKFLNNRMKRLNNKKKYI